VSATQSGEAQTQNVAQQKMAQSILNFCGGGGAAQAFGPPGPQQNLAQILCQGLGGGGSPNAFNLTPAQQNVALSQLNGGSELLVPVSQPSLLENTQPSRQTGVVEARLFAAARVDVGQRCGRPRISTHRASRDA